MEYARTGSAARQPAVYDMSFRAIAPTVTNARFQLWAALPVELKNRCTMSAPKPTAGLSTIERDEIDALRLILEGTAYSTGREFFQSLVEHLATAMGRSNSFVAEFAGENRVRTLAYWMNGKLVPNIEYDLAGTPCEEVIRGNLCHYPVGVSKRFPGDSSAG